MDMIAGQIRKFRDDEDYVPLTHKAQTKTTMIDFYGDNEPEWFTQKDARSYWKASAWLGLPATMWRTRDPGLIRMTEECRTTLRKLEITDRDAFAMRDLLTTKADVRADNLFEGHDWLTIKYDKAVFGETNPGLIFGGTVALTPDVNTKKFGRGFVTWCVQSIDVDDREDTFPNLDDALIRAATRAFEKQLHDKSYRLGLDDDRRLSSSGDPECDARRPERRPLSLTDTKPKGTGPG